MKEQEQKLAIQLRQQGLSINEISSRLNVAKSSVSLWVRSVVLTEKQIEALKIKGHYRDVIKRRRQSRLVNEEKKRTLIIENATKMIKKISPQELLLIGVMLYWAEGGKTRRTVRFSNGDPEMIKIMMAFFRRVCEVPEKKFRGYIHIHPHLNVKIAETYWSSITDIPKEQFFKTYRKVNISSKSKKDTLPYGTLDIYVLDTKLFYKIVGWSKGVFLSY